MQKILASWLISAAVFACLLAGTARAAAPSPEPKPTPPVLQWSGYDRAYYFTRTNAANHVNQASFNDALDVHGQLRLGGGFGLGATYLYADPFDGCSDPASHIAPGNCKTKTTPGSQLPPPTTYDDTLPAYRLSTLDEGYLEFHGAGLSAWIGRRVINTPWANASDSRLKPVSFRGADATAGLGRNWHFEVADYVAWEDRVQSDFVRSTILTQNGSYPDAGGIGTTGIAAKSWVNTNGFTYARLGYAARGLSAGGYAYAFDNLANAVWFDAKYALAGRGKAFIAFQGGTERSAGTAIAGKIQSTVFGVQAGVTPWKHVDLSLSFDDVPQRADTITLPAGVSCSGGLITGAGPAHPLGYFLPGAGSPNCSSATPGVAGGVATIYYGGWASPYTDSFATDPFYTTSMSQGMVDRRSPGSAVRVASTIAMANNRLRLILAHAWYQYGNRTTGFAPTQETNADATYFFNPVPAKGPYHGFSLRHRYADRETMPRFGGLPFFKYNRTQLEYDF